MEIRSETPTETITGCDLDLRFLGQSYFGTLYPTDSFELTDDEILIRFASGGLVTIRGALVLVDLPTRAQITRPLPKPNPPIKESRDVPYQD